MLNRLKQYIDYKGLTVASIERTLGMANGTLAKPIRNHTAIGSDKLENILAFCPDLSLTWLFTGRGEMLQLNGETSNPVSATDAALIERNLLQTMIIDKDTTIIKQAEEIGQLRERIKQLEQRLEKDATNVSTASIANAG